MADQLKVNLNTVNKAYKELEIQSVLETQQGTGTFIGPISLQIPKEEKGSLIIVPSSALESMNLGAIGGLSALSEMNVRE